MSTRIRNCLHQNSLPTKKKKKRKINKGKNNSD